ncbi:unnamed protein product [Phaedon cochleariae]|uniref:PHD-type domain-containing protein n=1 Tax=Phaedon cochleariae TaxID=80249 RepID=A0A9N9X571_PHACE|nr:unnamed protein product [Phaedon cochleariae]
MPDPCVICTTAITRSNPGITCRGPCRKLFHLKCAKLPSTIADVPQNAGLTWNCEKCLNSGSESVLSITQFDQLLQKMNMLSNDLSQVKSQNCEIVKSLQFFSDKIDDFSKKMETFDDTVKTVDVIQNDIQKLRAENVQLRTDIEWLQQQGRLLNSEIRGFPEQKNENLIDIVISIAKSINCIVNKNDIQTAHRVSPYNRDNDVKDPKTCRGIVVSFSNMKIKNSFMNAVRLNNKSSNIITADQIDTTLENRKIFISDHLSPANKFLHKKTRDFCKNNNFQFCWIKDSKIFVRKNTTSRIIQVINESTIDKLLN